MRRTLAVVVAVLVGAGILGVAQDQAPDQNAPPVSNALVARLSVQQGNVSTQRGDTGEWVAGTINTPLVSGDKVAAGAGSRAEVQLDYADMLRLGDNSQANLVNLDKNQIQVQLGSGLADYVVLKGAQANSEIDTPNVSIRPRGAGVFRILIPSESETQVVVRSGEADISTPQGSTTLHSGQQMDIQGTDAPQYEITDAPGQDSWDQWNENRDNSLRAAQSLQYTNPYYTGVQDLDGYGYWIYVPGYGRVWVPNNEGPGWSPYSNGSWQWQPYWGWTWVDYSPWGWAPYHYGRWFVYGANWVWWPGPVTPWYRPVWAPAYVSFFGWGGGGWGFGVGFGSVGWLPIGPCDPYRPWWGGRRFTQVNITNINITNINYVNVRDGRIVPPLAAVGRGRVVYSNLTEVRTNARVRDGLIRVPGSQFGHGRIVGREHVSANEVRQSAVLGGTLPARPVRASLGSTARVSQRALPQHVATRFFNAPSHGFVGAPRAEARGAVGAGIRPAAPRHFEAAGTLAQSGRIEQGGQSARPQPARPEPMRPQAARPQEAAPRAGWHSFGGGNAAATPRPAERPFTPRETAPREMPRESAPASPRATPHEMAPSRPGWQSFHPNGAEPRPTYEAGPRYSAPREMPRASQGEQPTFRPAPSPRFESGARPMPQQPQRMESRPTLPMDHPIVSAPRPESHPSGGGGGGESHVVHSGGGHPHGR